MPSYNSLVRNFHVTGNLTVNDLPSLMPEKIVKLRSKLVREEYEEFKAVYDLLPSEEEFASLPISKTELLDIHVKVVKEACDLLYVVLGTLVSMGVDTDKVFNMVHTNNMEKLNTGYHNEYGKYVVPPEDKSRLKQKIYANLSGYFTLYGIKKVSAKPERKELDVSKIKSLLPPNIYNYSTHYYDNGTKYAFYVYAPNSLVAEKVCELRGLGEKLVDSELNPYRSPTDISNRLDKVSLGVKLHTAIIHSYMAINSGIYTAKDLLSDTGILHRLIHNISLPVNSRYSKSEWGEETVNTELQRLITSVQDLYKKFI